MDRVISVDDGAGITRFTYYDNGSRKSVLYPDGSSETYVYDENGQNTALVNRKADNTLIDTYTYTYDAANHQTSKTDAKGQTTFTYDKLGRLATIIEPSGVKTAYTYDKAGNRTGEKKYMGEVLTQDTQYRYDANNRLLSTETKSQVLGTTDRVAYTYDANGNMLSQMTTSIKPAEIGNQATFVLEKSGASPNTLTRYTYDGFNQLKTSDDGTHKITYAYNGLGYRVEKSVTTGPTESPVTRTSRYLYEYDKVVLEVDAAGNEVAKNTYGTNLLSREMADITVYYMYNGHGDVTALLNTAGDTVATYYYDVWGNILEKMESASVSNPFRYAGYQYDEETDLYYLNARYYDAKIARFLTEDTYTGRQNDPLSLNLYTYCINNPIIYVDPTGNTEVFVEDIKIGNTSSDGKTGNLTDIAKAMGGSINWDPKTRAATMTTMDEYGNQTQVVYDLDHMGNGSYGIASDGSRFTIKNGKIQIGIADTIFKYNGQTNVVTVMDENDTTIVYTKDTSKVFEHAGVGYSKATNYSDLTIYIPYVKNGERTYVPYSYENYMNRMKAMNTGVSLLILLATKSYITETGGINGLNQTLIMTSMSPDFQVDYTSFAMDVSEGDLLGSSISFAAMMSIMSSTGFSKLVDDYDAVFARAFDGRTKILSGKWVNVNESMSDASRLYQKQITGKEGQAFLQNGVKFDGVNNGILIEAKGSYNNFVNKKTGEFYDWFKGKDSLVDQANRQIAASEGAQISWYFSDQATMNATKDLFQSQGIKGINYIFESLK